jgi:FixJ family two-component response regulator
MAIPRGNVVLVEDDWGLNQALTRLLQAAGFRVTGFSSGVSALQSEAARKADCLILDVQLGETSGYEVQRRLADAGYKPPVIVITAHDDVASRVQAQAIGVAAYLAKPFPGRVLVDAVTKLIPRDDAKK